MANAQEEAKKNHHPILSSLFLWPSLQTSMSEQILMTLQQRLRDLGACIARSRLWVGMGRRKGGEEWTGTDLPHVVGSDVGIEAPVDDDHQGAKDGL